MEIKFTLPIDCRPAPRPRITRKASFYPEWYTNLRSTISKRAETEMKRAGYLPVRCPVKLEVQVERTYDIGNIKYGDVDNLLKTVMDALTEICYDDDRFIQSVTIKKLTAQTPKLTVRLYT